MGEQTDRAGELANFLAAPAPDFFPRSSPALASGIFFRAALAPASRGQIKPAPAPDYCLSLAKYLFFSSQTSKVKLQKI